nr:protein translation factor SUI1 homolog [Tanacetum cinerariifolium]
MILKDLKEFCCNDTVVHDKELGKVIQLQGDQRKNVSVFLTRAGIVKKEQIKIHNLQVSNNRLSQQVSTLQAQVMGEEKLKAAFEEFKQYEDNRVEQRGGNG